MISRPKLTADEARQFSGTSLANYIAVKTALAAQGCTTCEPYVDVFTLRRWNAQGYRVRKGAKAIKIPVVVTDTREDSDTGETATVTKHRTACVFCRCQTKEATA